MPAPTTLPTYGWFGEHAITLLRGTSEGAVCVVGTSGLEEVPTPTWTVIGATGRPQAIVTANSEMEVLDATATVALVRTWDKDGIERVELRKLMPLHKPAPARR